ncbi:MAG: hypothetical protein A2Z69_00540 [Bacteroidetes bacterium RBG_13_44_24]|nr:MAG: hypothetical protein A2Z69_00540 [Bacteroidetes bacterium RBG_13_44_24]
MFRCCCSGARSGVRSSPRSGTGEEFQGVRNEPAEEPIRISGNEFKEEIAREIWIGLSETFTNPEHQF